MNASDEFVVVLPIFLIIVISFLIFLVRIVLVNLVVQNHDLKILHFQIISSCFKET